MKHVPDSISPNNSFTDPATGITYRPAKVSISPNDTLLPAGTSLAGETGLTMGFAMPATGISSTNATLAIPGEPITHMPDVWVCLRDGRIVATHDEPFMFEGIQAVRYRFAP